LPKNIKRFPDCGHGKGHAVMLELELMNLADVESVAELEKLCFPEDPWPPEVYRDELADEHETVYLVVRVANDASVRTPPTLVANGGFHLEGDAAYITTIATHPWWRRCKIGEWLLLHLLRAARRMGARTVTLHVRARNVAAVEFYRKHGFAVAGRVKRYYGNEAALVLTLPDLDGSEVSRRLAEPLQDPE
jgi:ribosomal protein S18 acetylase RimI-like enzyme